jgi:hypothetical protein
MVRALRPLALLEGISSSYAMLGEVVACNGLTGIPDTQGLKFLSTVNVMEERAVKDDHALKLRQDIGIAAFRPFVQKLSQSDPSVQDSMPTRCRCA